MLTESSQTVAGTPSTSFTFNLADAYLPGEGGEPDPEDPAEQEIAFPSGQEGAYWSNLNFGMPVELRGIPLSQDRPRTHACAQGSQG